MNVHHLELFYYVARHGGISRAVRNMPYGIQQPAVSSQIRLLEQDLGVKLFERSPFKLTPAGVELDNFVRPFFENLNAMALRLRAQGVEQLRIGASELVLRDHLPAVIQRMKQDHPELRLALRSGFQPELESWLHAREIDLAIVPLRGRVPPGVRCLRLLRLPLVLLVNKQAKTKSAAEVLAQKRPVEPLVCLPPTEIICQAFQAGLRKRGITWPLAVEASSMELVTQFVANGDGVGVNLGIPSVVRHRQVRVLPLTGFGEVELAALWHGEPSPLLRAVLAEMQGYVAQQWPEWATGDKLPG
ncbi:MAG TPA: LysR family transcriptional regulator [Lacunisphaera sp.]|nr:LysR family transcriptional regulator [Lacunisphaera sp.]